MPHSDQLASEFLQVHFCYEHNTTTQEARGFTLRSWNGDFYRYGEGCYAPLSKDEVKALVSGYLQARNNQVRTADRFNVTDNLINNVLACLRGREGVHVPESTRINSWTAGANGEDVQTLAFSNGLLLVSRDDLSATLAEHTPDYFGVTKLPYDYDETAECPQWVQFLSDVMEGDEQRMRLLQEWAGYILTPDLRHQRFLLCVGRGANGKGVFFEVIESMVGRENCSHVTLRSFGTRFALTSTLGKLLNTTTESSEYIDPESETLLKAFVAGDAMTFDRKYRSPIEAVPTAKVMIATNELPRFQDTTHGVWRRMLLVPFERTYAAHEQNRHLADELRSELPGIFNWALEGMRLLHENEVFVQSAVCEAARRNYRQGMNPAGTFLEDNYVIGEASDGLFVHDVYRHYRDWCEENGYHPRNIANFGVQLNQKFPNLQREMRPRPNGGRGAFYWGLARREEAEDSHPTF
jgi:P4 family phage/plasmid primase-like protien